MSNPRFEAGSHMATTLSVLKSFFKFSPSILHVNKPEEKRKRKSEKTGGKGNRLPNNEEKLREIQ